MKEPSYVDAKDLKDVNYNLKLLVQKYNHEHSVMVKDISKTKNDISQSKDDISGLRTAFTRFEAYAKGMKTMLSIILGIITVVGTLIGVGVVFS